VRVEPVRAQKASESRMSSPSTLANELPPAIEGVWFVKLQRSVVPMTLERLDEAYQHGEIDAGTSVFTAGMSSWDTLGVVADLDESGGDGASPGASAPARAQAPAYCRQASEGDSFAPSISNSPLQSPAFEPVLATGVRHRFGRLPFSLRRTAARVVEAVGRLGMARPRLRTVGIWAAGGVMSAAAVLLLYELGTASTQSLRARALISARTTPVEAATASGAGVGGHEAARTMAERRADGAAPMADTNPSSAEARSEAAPSSRDEGSVVVEPIRTRLASARTEPRSTRAVGTRQRKARGRATRLTSQAAASAARGSVNAKPASSSRTKKATRRRAKLID
jgi:hypothetical protein